ncbi:NmrA family NAD(P)-binding protein [Nocardioides anomalus]|uniref:NmrA family NAD(P)-binding protein n=1 Tax=Nocardioides anomalus TaxID=2712223 RepID=A0A6G6WII3_9ACTN|nr:NmrA family NAD(P)-binding protein [Nocardioides anomalus]QIG44870.1 NmrA family NAD(P)-binding protein [Nocardioides anomalus]
MTTPCSSHQDSSSQRLPAVAVVGGHGKTGRRIAAKLEALGHDVRVLGRRATPAFDWAAPEGWAEALAGASAAYVAFAPDLAVPGGPDAVTELTRVALGVGCQRVVLLSGRGEAEAQRAERMVLEACPAATVVRCAWFAQNFTETDFAELVRGGSLTLPGGEAAEPFVDVEDIADVAVAALTDATHAGEVYELTGPAALTLGEVAAVLSAVGGAPVGYVPISLADLEAGLRADGVPEEVVGLMGFLFGSVFGRNPSVADGVRRALGRPPTDLRTALVRDRERAAASMV